MVELELSPAVSYPERTMASPHGGTPVRAPARRRAPSGLGLAPLLAAALAVAEAPDARGHEHVAQSPAVTDGIQPAVVRAPSLVRAGGRQLLVRKRRLDGTLGAEEPYVIRGVFWSPAGPTTNTTPSDRNNANVRRPEYGKWYLQDIPLMAAMHVNTVRLSIDPGFDATLGPVGLAVLDELHRHGIMAIITVDDGIASAARIAGAVAYYRHHPAVLMWSLGSEWNINRWDPPPAGPAPTGYAINVAGSYVGTLTTPRRSFASAAPRGTYNVSIVATNPCGASAPTAVRTVAVS
jgi:hypothetical protein